VAELEVERSPVDLAKVLQHFNRDAALPRDNLFGTLEKI